MKPGTPEFRAAARERDRLWRERHPEHSRHVGEYLNIIVAGSVHIEHAALGKGFHRLSVVPTPKEDK